MKKILIVSLLFYLLTLMETSFFAALSPYFIPNLVLIAVLLINIFELREKKSGIYIAAIGGFFWDVFSSKPIGFHLIILLASAFFIKVIIKKYVEVPAFIFW